MARVYAYLDEPVQAEVVESFGVFKENQKVMIDRVADRGFFGAEGVGAFIPSTKVNEGARKEVAQRLLDSSTRI